MRFISHRVRNWHLIRSSHCRDSCPNMDRQPHELFTHVQAFTVEAFTGVNSNPHLEPEHVHVSQYGGAAVDLISCVVESSEEAVPGSSEIASAEEPMLSSDDRPLAWVLRGGDLAIGYIRARHTRDHPTIHFR